MLLATGYVVDITRYPFFPLTLTRAFSSIDGYRSLAPDLNLPLRACTSSVWSHREPLGR